MVKMSKYLGGVILLCGMLSVSVARGQEVSKLKVTGPAGNKVAAGKMVDVSVTGADAKAAIRWTYDKSRLDFRKINRTSGIFSGLSGTYSITAESIMLDKEGNTQWDEVSYTFAIGEPGPLPPGPGPTPPGPTPPGPTPTPGVLPIAGDGLRVLIIEESGERAKLPIGQYNSMFGKRVNDYLRAKCAKDGRGEPEARVWDKDDDTSASPQHWKDAFKRQQDGGTDGKGKRASLPWVMIANGKDGIECPLPKTVDETIALLTKFGG